MIKLMASAAAAAGGGGGGRPSVKLSVAHNLARCQSHNIIIMRSCI